MDFDLLNDIEEIKDKINYMSFGLKSKPTSDLSGISKIEDCWYHDLRLKHFEHINKKFDDKLYRSGVPPYGRYFALGHPSPGAHEDIANKIINFANENYS